MGDYAEYLRDSDLKGAGRGMHFDGDRFCLRDVEIESFVNLMVIIRVRIDEGIDAFVV